MATTIPQNPVALPTPAPGAAAPAGTHPSGSLYCGDLAPDVTEALLFEIFNPIGPVSSIRVCRDSTTRRSLGYAYVNFHNASDAERALDTLNFCTIKGRPCRIMWSHRDPSIRKSAAANIFIKNLDKSIDHKELYDTFSQFGSISSCKVATDASGVSRGYGFVHYMDEADAARAIADVNGKLIKQKKVIVTKFERHQDRHPTGGPRFTNLYIKFIPEEWDEVKLQSVFEPFGKITSLVIRRGEDGKSKGFGFVNFENFEDARRALDEGNKISTGDDKVLFVDRFQKKVERAQLLSKKYEDRRRERSEQFKNVNLYVKNLEDDIDDAKLKEIFISFGEIVSCVVMRDDKNVSRGFGFVCFVNPDDAQKALNELNSKIIGSKPIYVNRAQRKEERRQHLEGQFQANLAQRMQAMPAMFYAPPHSGMGMAQPVMYPPQMMGRRFPPQMRAGYPPYAPVPQQQQRPRNMQGGAQRPLPPNARPGPLANPKYRQQQQGPRYPREAMGMGAHGPMPGGAVPHMSHAAMMPVELTASALAAATPEMQKQMLGERLFPLVQKVRPDLAGKITGMLLEIEVSEILSLLENPQELHLKVDEAVRVLAETTV